MYCCITQLFLLQLYEIDDDPKRKEFLDDLFNFMQKRGNDFYDTGVNSKNQGILNLNI